MNHRITIAIDVTMTHVDGMITKVFNATDLNPVRSTVPHIANFFSQMSLTGERVLCRTHFGRSYNPLNRYNIAKEWLTDDDPLWNKSALPAGSVDTIITKPNDFVIDAPGIKKLLSSASEVVICGFFGTCCVNNALRDISFFYPDKKIIVPLDCIGSRLSRSEKAENLAQEWRKNGICVVPHWKDLQYSQ
jgi:nicotinamidase-related amidase